MNSRLLTHLSTDSTDYTAVTPGHFLVGRPLMSLREENVSLTPINRLSR